MTVPNIAAINTGVTVSPIDYMNNYKDYLTGATLNSRTAGGSGKEVNSMAPAWMGPMPGWGMNTTGYSYTRIGVVFDRPDRTPILTVAGTELALPSNLNFSVVGGTGTLQFVVNAKATRLLRPIYTKLA
jgi:hypothetical protein